MKRYEKIKPDILHLYSTIKDPINKELCITHHKNVLREIMKYTENECLYIAALFHDISTYLGIRGNHAYKSAQYAKDFLLKYHLFSKDELQLIYDVICVHSQKDIIHFYEAELLKQADKKVHELESMYDN